MVVQKTKFKGIGKILKNEGYQVEIKDNVFEITQSGLTLKGKIEEDKDGNLKADIDGDKAKVDYQNDKLIIDKTKFKKID